MTTENNVSLASDAKKKANAFDKSERQTIRIPLAMLDTSHNIRSIVKDESYEGVKLSMQLRGQDEPIQVSAFTRDGKHWVAAGNHRTEIARELKWSHIDAVIREDIATESEFIKLMIRSNVARKQLTTGEQLKAVMASIEAFKKDPDNKGKEPDAAAVAADIGRSVKHVQNLMRVAREGSSALLKATCDELKIKGDLVVSFDRAAKWVAHPKEQQDALLAARVKYLEGAPDEGEAVPGTGAGGPGAGPSSTDSTKKVKALGRDAIVEYMKAAEKAPEFYVMLDSKQQHTCTDRERALIARVLDQISTPVTRAGNPRDIVRWEDDPAEAAKDEAAKAAKAAKGTKKGAKK